MTVKKSNQRLFRTFCKISLTALCITVYLSILPSMGFANDKLRFAGVSDIVPLSYSDQGVPNGIFVDLFKEVTKRAGVHVEITLYPFKRMWRNLEYGSIDGTISLFHDKKREELVSFITPPILNARIILFTAKGSTFKPQSMKDLYGKNIGVLQDWKIYNTKLDDAMKIGKIETYEVSSHTQLVRMLAAKRLDGIIAPEFTTWHYANEAGVQDKISASNYVLSNRPTYITINKKPQKIADHNQLNKRLSSAIKSITEDGTHQSILNKYKFHVKE